MRLFDFRGRTNRIGYLVDIGICYLLAALAGAVAQQTLQEHAIYAEPPLDASAGLLGDPFVVGVFAWIFAVLLLISWGIYFPASVRRLHDLGASWRWALTLLLGPLGLVLVLVLLLYPGSPSENKYGGRPPTLPVWLTRNLSALGLGPRGATLHEQRTSAARAIFMGLAIVLVFAFAALDDRFGMLAEDLFYGVFDWGYSVGLGGFLELVAALLEAGVPTVIGGLLCLWGGYRWMSATSSQPVDAALVDNPQSAAKPPPE
jgi:uncharacterized membrane protein YhaH (DUF805 family)